MTADALMVVGLSLALFAALALLVRVEAQRDEARDAAARWERRASRVAAERLAGAAALADMTETAKWWRDRAQRLEATPRLLATAPGPGSALRN